MEETLATTGADPKRLVLELTEHVMLADIDEVVATMRRLKEIGVRFALDDFGTGYSSLSYLKRLPFDTLKIDRSFVRDIETDPNDREIIQTILNIARSMKVSVIAEGVETPMQALLLRQLGCHVVSGLSLRKAEIARGFSRGAAEHRSEHRAADRPIAGGSVARLDLGRSRRLNNGGFAATAHIEIDAT